MTCSDTAEPTLGSIDSGAKCVVGKPIEILLRTDR